VGSSAGSLVLAMAAGKAKSNRASSVRMHEGTPRYSEPDLESLPKGQGVARWIEVVTIPYTAVPA